MLDDENIRMKRPKLISLQALRALAFISVFLNHTTGRMVALWGVSVFFVLSGFLLIYTNVDSVTNKKTIKSFPYTVNKIKKLYPLYLITTVACIPLIKLSGDSFHKLVYLIKSLLLNIFLVQSWSPNSLDFGSLNAVSWYLSTLAILYFFSPMILKWMSKVYRMKHLAIVTSAIIIVQLFTGYFSTKIIVPTSVSKDFVYWFTYIFPLYRLGDYLIGCNVAILFLHFKRDISRQQALILEILGIVSTGICSYLAIHQFAAGVGEWFIFTTLFLPSSALLVYVFALNKGLITKTLTNHWLISVGNLSGHTYLIHQVVIRYFYLFLSDVQVPNIVKKIIILIAAFVFTVFLSVMYKKLVVITGRATRLET